MGVNLTVASENGDYFGAADMQSSYMAAYWQASADDNFASATNMKMTAFGSSQGK